jgi:hypothetical protein
LFQFCLYCCSVVVIICFMWATFYSTRPSFLYNRYLFCYSLILVSSVLFWFMCIWNCVPY